MGDDPGALGVQQDMGLTGCDAEVVKVAGLFEVAFGIGLGIEFALAAAPPNLTLAHRRGGAH